jgi:hypothetical protein
MYNSGQCCCGIERIYVHESRYDAFVEQAVALVSLDLYVASSAGTNHYFRTDAGTFVDATAGPLGDSGAGAGVAWADADGNGSPDLFVATAGAPGKLYLNFSGTANHWIGVRLAGAAPNTSALGAHVRATAGSVVQHRWITSGSGFQSQGSRVQHIGLGAAAVVDEILVTWPNGTQQSVTTPPVDALLVIVEGAATQAVVVAPARLPGPLLMAAPNPFRHSTVISCELPRAGLVHLRVLDVTGRLVRTLLREPREAGAHAVHWDGRNASGATVASGIYYYRLDAGDVGETRSVVKVR